MIRPGIINESQQKKVETARQSASSAGSDLRLSAIIELAVFMGLFLAVDYVLGTGDRFWAIAPHPLWAVVILLSVQYGTTAGLIAAIACSAALLTGHLPVQNVDQDYYDYLLYIGWRPIVWMLSALFLGELRRRQLVENAELHAEVAQTHLREETLSKAYSSTMERVNFLERQIATQAQTVLTVFRAAQNVERLEVGDVITGIESLVEEILAPNKFSVFVPSRNNLDALVSHGWDTPTEFSRQITGDSALYSVLLTERRTLMVTREADSLIMGSDALIAIPIQNNVTGDVIAVIRIEEIDFDKLNSSLLINANLLSQWLSNAFAKAETYENSAWITADGSRRAVVSSQLWPSLSDWLLQVCRRNQMSLWRLDVQSTKRVIANDEILTLTDQIARGFSRELRNTDLVFQRDGRENGTIISILLIGIDETGVAIVQGKLREHLQSNSDQIISGLGLSPVCVIDPATDLDNAKRDAP
ncbi:hypothetical protein [Thalassospira mesophila]|uniref:GAF domain-containing protein n=1 Tax=Thalassospira mesophila TaxID=1293891 RepID=A0A1Y2KVH0_9PROT|nr:hypothetical protein [Thalassospira mesophila]OSQ35564.1 hypothetical protein TMES_20790 [Thalassospira mesophila]